MTRFEGSGVDALLAADGLAPGPHWYRAEVAAISDAYLAHTDSQQWRGTITDQVYRWFLDKGWQRSKTKIPVGQQALAKKFGVSRATIRRAIDRLIEAGWLVRISPGLSRRGKPTPIATGYQLSSPRGSHANGVRALSQPRREVRSDGLAASLHTSRTGLANRPSGPRSGPSLKSKIEQGPVTPGPLSLTSLVGPPQTGETQANETQAKQVDETQANPTSVWLKGLLQGHPVSAADVVSKGAEAGYSRATIYRAAKALGVVRIRYDSPARRGEPPRHVTMWSLPGDV